MTTFPDQPTIKPPNPMATKKQSKESAIIAKNKNPNIGKADTDAKAAKAPSKDSPQPKDTAGTEVYDRSSTREGERFDSGDVVFFREGPGAPLQALPKHEADERLVEISSRESEFKDHRTVTVLELKGGDKVTIDGAKVIVTPKKGPATTDGPSLNVHHADIQG